MSVCTYCKNSKKCNTPYPYDFCSDFKPIKELICQYCDYSEEYNCYHADKPKMRYFYTHSDDCKYFSIGDDDKLLETLEYGLQDKTICKNNIHRPHHYNTYGFTPIDAMGSGLVSEREFIGFLKGSALKYLIRCEYKNNSSEDIDKCIEYLNLLKKVLNDEYNVGD